MRASVEKQIVQMHEAGRCFDLIVQSALQSDGNVTRDDVARVIQMKRWSDFKTGKKKGGRK